MAQFDESKVINVLHSEKAEIGKKYYHSDKLLNLKRYVEENDTYCMGELTAIRKYGDCALFTCNNVDDYQFLYPYEEQNQRMTRIQFIEWVNKGNGIYKYRNGSSNCYSYNSSLEEELNNELDEDIVIRTWDSEEWVEPTIDIYERDCKKDN